MSVLERLYNLDATANWLLDDQFYWHVEEELENPQTLRAFTEAVNCSLFSFYVDP